MKRILLAFNIMAFGLNCYGDTLCTDANLRRSYEYSAKPQPLETFNLEPTSKSRLIMLGETHYYTDSELLLGLIKKFALPMRPRKCLFLEFSSAVHPQEMISKVEEALAKLPLGPSEERTDYEQMLRYFKPLVTAAAKHSMQVFSVDHPKNFGQGMAMNTRDEAMKKTIVNLLGPEGSCDDAVMFVGKGHITASEANRVLLAKELKELVSFQVTTINVLEASDPVPESFVSWSKVCRPPPFEPKGTTYIFSNSIFSPDLEMWPNHKGTDLLSGKWRDFDYTVIAP